MAERIEVKLRRQQLCDVIDALYLAEAAAREDMEILNSMDLKDTQTVQELAEAQTRYHKLAYWLQCVLEEAGDEI